MQAQVTARGPPGAQRIAPTQNNLYHFKDGRIINGEDVVYNPTAVAKNAAEVFGEDWQDQNMPE